MGKLRIEPLREGLPFGCRVTGLTLENVADPEVRAELQQAFEDKGLIVFNGVEPTNRMQIALSRVFGRLKDHPVTAVDKVDEDELRGAIKVAADPANADIVEIDGVVYSSWLPWHFDHCYNNQLNRAGVLRLVVPTPNGGQTCFMDGVELYRQFPPELLRQIETCSVIYSLDMQPDHIRFGRPENFRVLQVDPKQGEILEQAKNYPRSIHPAVWTRDSGEKVLHFSPWMAEGIEGREDAEGDALLHAATQELIRLAEAGCYVHDWKPDDMIIWDNWRVLHRVTGCTPPHPREIYRSTIEGDYGLGRFEGDDKGQYKVLETTTV